MDGLNELKGILKTVEADILTLKTDVSTLKTDVSTLKADVSTLKSDMVTVKLDLATKASAADVAEVKTKLETKLEKMSDTLVETRVDVAGLLSVSRYQLAVGDRTALQTSIGMSERQGSAGTVETVPKNPN